MPFLEQRVAVVTGASREIGAAMAKALASAGAAVVVAHFNEAARAAAVVAEIQADGGQAAAFDADLALVAANRALITFAVETFGRVDIFAANAGLTVWSPFLETEEATYDTVANLNLKGSYFGAQAAARQMVAQRSAGDDFGGRIVFSSSVTGIQAAPNGSAYAITKAGLRHMARVLGVELGSHGITVNAIGIGATLNERNLRDDADYQARWDAVTPTGRVGMPEDVAAALLFLVSPAAHMVTGQTLVIDGGWTATARMP